MELATLLTAVPDARVTGRAGRPVTGVVEHTRLLAPGVVFVAVPGFTRDGHEFVGAAREQGAAAVVVERGRVPLPEGWDAEACAWVETGDTRLALSGLAAAWYGYPAEQMRVVGVTGTDGKTTTSHMTAAVLDAAGWTTGLISTAQFKLGGRWEDNPTRQTSLEPLEVQALLARMRDAAVTHAVVESSSHGLALRKLDHCAFDAAVVTNVTEDHLDFHRTRAGYLAAKARLLDLTGRSAAKPGTGLVVLNADDRSYEELGPRASGAVISYGVERDADLRATVLDATAAGTRALVRGRRGEATLWVPMPGAFNVSNALAAVAVAVGLGIPLQQACAALERFPGVPGRMLRVDAGQPFGVIVDYAHTGHSFRKLLDVLRPLTAGQLIVVFGSAGEQSHERRAGMGLVAAALADFAVLTSEDPRHEDPDAIIAGIARVMADAGRAEGRDFISVTDRREAIRAAFSRARPGDLVVLAGKGHEQSIIVGDEKLPWDERSVAEQELAAMGWGRDEPPIHADIRR